MNRQRAQSQTQNVLDNPEADFRDGQWKAINSLANQRQKLLVAQGASWGKSEVCSIATRILKDHGYGPSSIISLPLTLMRNKIEAARGLGTRTLSIDLADQGQNEELPQRLMHDECDCLLVSPER